MLKSETLLRLEEIYKLRNLASEDDFLYSITPYDKFCSLLEKLNEEQQNVILFLLEDYLKVGSVDYYKNLFLVLSKVENFLKKGEKICFLPLKQSIGPNSSQMACGFTKSPGMKNIFFKNKIETISDNNDIDELLKELELKNIDYYIFLDDFIGTGTTAEQCLNNLYKRGLNKNKTILATLISQKTGFDYVQKICKKAFSGCIRLKGISENPRLTKDEKDEFVRIMNDIEDIINVKAGDDIKFGYGKSESLITLSIRTPNNTFPVFWKPKGKSNENFILAPFPRF